MKGWRRISGALPQVDWTLTFDLQETAKPRFHTNHRRPTKQTAPCSSPFWVERSSGYPKYLASHEGWLNWPVTGSQLITGTLDRLKKKTLTWVIELVHALLQKRCKEYSTDRPLECNCWRASPPLHVTAMPTLNVPKVSTPDSYFNLR